MAEKNSYDVILINPNIREATDSGEGVLPPLGICYISSYLKSKGVSCRIIDANALKLDESMVIEMINESKPLIAGITATTPVIEKAYGLAAKIRASVPRTKLMLGGPHASVLPEQTMDECSRIDFIVCGEGELTVHELVTTLKNGGTLENIKGLCYRSGGAVIRNTPRERIENLDSLPFPDRSDLPMNKYLPSIKWFNRTPFATLMTSRGCPNDCIFCASKQILGRAVRFRSISNIIEELKELISLYGIKEVMFYDDTFTLNKRHAEDLCDAIISEKLDLTWGCLSRVDRVDGPLLEKMKKAGCHIMSFGIESGSEIMLNQMRKKITLEQIKNAVKAAKQAGINTSASFVFGVPGETEQTMEETINLAVEIDPLFAQFYRVVPFPGTDLYSIWKNQQFSASFSWKDFLEVGNAQNLIKLDSISAEKFNQLLKLSYKKFYFRPKKIIELAFKMSSPYKLKGLLIAVMAYLKLIVIPKDSH